MFDPFKNDNDIIPDVSLMQTGNKEIVNNEQPSTSSDANVLNEQPSISSNEIANVFNEQPSTSSNEIANVFNNEQNGFRQQMSTEFFGGGNIGQPDFHQQPIDKSKYKFIDLFWLFSEKIKNKEYNFQQNEAHFVNISYNISFTNLRIALFVIQPNAIQNHVVFYNNLKRLTSGTIYPADCFKLINTQSGSFICKEQLFADTNADWQKNRPICQFQITEENIKLSIADKQVIFSYIFENWQKKAIQFACKYVFDQGLGFTALNKIHNG